MDSNLVSNNVSLSVFITSLYITYHYTSKINSMLNGQSVHVGIRLNTFSIMEDP